MAHDSTSRDGVDRLLDLALFAPIGLLLEARSLAPELAERGRRQVELARMLGAQAMRFGAARVDGPARSVLDALGLVPEAPARPAPDRTEPSSATPLRRSAAEDPSVLGGPVPPQEATAAAEPTAPAPPPAIPDYDSLSAPQVVRRLDGLATDELEEVRRYEATTRGRRTILAKIARLQA